MLKIKIFKHRHKWKNTDNFSLYEEGWDYWYECKCGAIKRKFIGKKEEIIEKVEE